MAPNGWRSACIGDAVAPISRPEVVANDRVYALLGVRWYGKGGHIHMTVDGADLKTPTLNRVAMDDITYNKMWVTKGAFAVVAPELDGVVATNEYPLFSARPDRALPGFLRWALTTESFVKVATDAARGTTSRKRLNPGDFLRLPLLLPPVPEQRKIAAILSAVDDAIEGTQAVIDQLQVVKKATMAELLTRGVPGQHTRFKQTALGEVPTDWKVVRLESVLSDGPTNGLYKPADLIGRGALIAGMTAIDGNTLRWVIVVAPW